MSKISILKIELNRAGSEVVSATNQLKLLAPGSKRTAFRVLAGLDMYPKTAFRVHAISDTYIVHTHSPIC